MPKYETGDRADRREVVCSDCGRLRADHSVERVRRGGTVVREWVCPGDEA
jgi:hypothetical protein